MGVPSRPWSASPILAPTPYCVNLPPKTYKIGVDLAQNRGYNELRKGGFPVDEKKARGSMMRMNITVPPRQHAYIKRVASAKGISLAEVVRRIIDDHISREEEQ